MFWTIIFVSLNSVAASTVKIKFWLTLSRLACENIRFSSLFVARDVSRNVPSDEERGETDVFAGYFKAKYDQRQIPQKSQISQL